MKSATLWAFFLVASSVGLCAAFLHRYETRELPERIIQRLRALSAASTSDATTEATPETTTSSSAEDEDFQADLRRLSVSLDKGFKEVRNVFKSLRKSVPAHQEIARVASSFKEAADRLTDFKRFTDGDARFDDNDDVIVDEESRAWAEDVLSEDSDGIRHVTDSVHGLIVGANETKPIIEVYMNGLRLGRHSDIIQTAEKLVDTLDNMQNMGYELWLIALDAAKRAKEQTTVVRPLMEQRTALEEDYLAVAEHFKVWPQGSYGLVKSAQGCPEGYWTMGSRYHDTEDNMNNWTPTNLDKYISGSFQASGIKWEFCMNAENNSTVSTWPSGKYCIFAGSKQCPTGFTQGWLFFDDENDSNGNTVSGSRPHGDYGVDTRYDFCCRNDGDENTEISLPLENPFVLFPLDQYSCQKVKWMTATELSLTWDCEDDDNQNDRKSPYPREKNQGEDMSIAMCYYD